MDFGFGVPTLGLLCSFQVTRRSYRQTASSTPMMAYDITGYPVSIATGRDRAGSSVRSPDIHTR